MDYEQKYKEALERAEILIEKLESNHIKGFIYHIFPELKESEDDKIRKELKHYLEVRRCQTKDDEEYINCNHFLAWLEKQGEQAHAELCQSEVTKTSDQELEPKSKVSQWIVDNESKDVFLIKSFNSGYCTLEDIKGNIFSPCELPFEEDCHLWTIDDAKDGDVLWHSDSASNGIFIFKEIRNDGKVLCYCDYDSEDGFCLGESHTCCWTDSKILHPATKEKRDILFTKMKEAGYEWDAENKRLTKIKKNYDTGKKAVTRVL